MAISATAIWEVETGGDDNSGGGFDTGVSGFPTDGAATSANTSSPIFSSASYNFVAGDVGAWLYIKSGTNWIPGWYKIASVASNNATLSAAVGAAVKDLGGLQIPSTALGCATTASPTAATWGIDYSQQSSAQITFTDMVIGATTTQFTSAAHPVRKNFVGNIINVTSGTGFTVQRVAVISTSGTTATCDKSLGTAASTGGNGNLGGALASPGMAGGAKLQGNDVWIASGTYTIAVTTVNAATGPVNEVFSTGGGVDETNEAHWEGYGTVRGDLGTAPILQVAASGVTSITIFNTDAQFITVRNITVDGNSKTSITGIAVNNFYNRIIDCTAKNTTVRGILLNDSHTHAIRCRVTGASGTSAFQQALSLGDGQTFDTCSADACSCIGFLSAAGQGTFISCIARDLTGASSTGYSSQSTGGTWRNCAAVNCGSHGWDLSGNSAINAMLVNCIAEGNAGWGYFTDGVASGIFLRNCAGYNNTSGDYNSVQILHVEFFKFGTTSFFINAPSGNFAPNNNTGGGALIRGTGQPGTWLDGLTTGYHDIGPAQHADPSIPGASIQIIGP